MPVDVESFKGKTDFGIISIREDEFLAVLERFAPDRYAMGSQRYEIGRVRTNGGGYYTVAAVRCVHERGAAPGAAGRRVVQALVAGIALDGAALLVPFVG